MSNKDEEELVRKLRLLQSGRHFQSIPARLPPRPKPSASQELIARNMAMAYPEFSTHDWGYFGEYEFLGPGTDYYGKRQADVKPRNRIDELAMMHDSQYEWTQENLNEPQFAVVKSMTRGLSDYGAGASMWLASLNPFNELSFKDRLLGLLAGEALMIQGAVRLSPVGWTAGPIVDRMIYF